MEARGADPSKGWLLRDGSAADERAGAGHQRGFCQLSSVADSSPRPMGRNSCCRARIWLRLALSGQAVLCNTGYITGVPRAWGGASPGGGPGSAGQHWETPGEWFQSWGVFGEGRGKQVTSMGPVEVMGQSDPGVPSDSQRAGRVCTVRALERLCGLVAGCRPVALDAWDLFLPLTCWGNLSFPSPPLSC